MKRKVMILALAALAAPTLIIAAHSDLGCDSCHVPHRAGAPGDMAGVPLWNPDRDADMSGITIYSSTTLDATVGQPDGNSKLCLSCHDGTGVFSAPGTGGHLGTDMSTTHPISFVFDDTLATSDGELYEPTTTNSGLGGTIDEDMLDPDHKLQCASCHDPHSSAAVADGYLRIANDSGAGGGQLCKTCHDK